jgi:DNA gyrase/topoisomerase IV subunit A
LKKDTIPNVVLNNLFKQTQLQTSFSVNNVALVKGRPKTLNLKDLIHYYVEHRHEVVVRRTQYELEEAEKRAHILQGYLIALDNLDEVIRLIRSSRDPEIARNGLIEKFELEQLVVFDTWFGEDTEEKIRIERSRAQKYYREVKAELLKGYGFILLEYDSRMLCMIVEEAEDQELHNLYLDAVNEEIGLWVPDIKNRVNTNIEKSFAMAQKEMCKIIYTEAKDLKVIMGGLERQKIPFTLSGLWATEDALSNLSSELAKEKSKFDRDLAKIRQDFEAQRILKETIEAEAMKKTNNLQKELRKNHSQEANGASNKVKVYLEAVFNPEKFAKRNSQEQLVETQTNFNRTFSEISRWWRIKEMSLWETSSYSFEIFDYGTAEWKGRRLETITGTFNIDIENRPLGQKDKKCVLLSIMIDDEFGYFRDSDEAKCSNSNSISAWQKARNFESRWIAN